jgi:hypothetical protein
MILYIAILFQSGLLDIKPNHYHNKMSTLYTLSTLNEYTWTAFYGDKQIFISYIAVSKSQAISGLTSLLQQLDYIKRKLEAGLIPKPQEYVFMNLHIQENKIEYSYSTVVQSTNNRMVTIGELLLNYEPNIVKFRLGTIRDCSRLV